MSFSDILNRLAEKKALQGDSDFAFRLISASEKEEEKDEKEAEMIKRGKDRKKVASKEVWIEAYEELVDEFIPKFMERGLGEDEAEQAAEKYLEKNYHLIDARAADKAGNAIDLAMDSYDDIYASTLSNMIKKYAGEDKEDKKKTSQELEIERYNRERDKFDRMKKRWDKFKSENPHHKKSSTLVSMIKKYAKEDWEVTGEEFYGGETPDLDFEDDNQFYDAMGRGFEDAKYTPESQSNPYSGNEELSAAYEAGVRHALEMLQQRGTKL